MLHIIIIYVFGFVLLTIPRLTMAELKFSLMSGNPQNRTNGGICMNILLVASGSSVNPCFMHVCAFAFLHISKSATTVKCDSPSFSHLFLLPLYPTSCQLLCPRVRGVRGYRLQKSAHDIGNTQVYMTHTSIQWTDIDLHIFMYPFMHKSICTQTVVLIKALSVSRKICNPDI